jgi:internalin A
MDRAPSGNAQRVARRIRKSFEDGTLSLADFDLGYVPEEIGKLEDLKELNLSGNALTTIPKFICELKNLRLLNLSQNRLSSLPTEFAGLSQLRTLGLSYNRDLRLPPLLSRFDDLRTIALGGLDLSEVPTFVRSLHNLSHLLINNNYLRELPDWLSELELLDTLDVRDNVLTSLPRSLLECRNLWTLYVQENPQLFIPTEIEQTGIAPRVLNYYFRTKLAVDRLPLNEFKLILVGRGLVGKTSLVHRLVSDKYKEFKRTPGINITKWPSTIDGEEVRAHIWDFGGQEIMHGTHRFFMTERALYLILLSGREGTEDRDAEYWLSMVRSFAGDAPVIILLHKHADYAFELNQELLREKYGKDLVFLATDSRSGDGIAALRDRIRALAKSLPGLKAAWPSEWRQIKDELPTKKENWLTFDDFRKYCAGFGIVEAKDQEMLAESLHDLGLMLSYRNDEALRHFGVLNPEWVTTGIYQMLNAPTLRQAGGRFTLNGFGDVLPKRVYPAELHPYLLALMRKFQLCHPLDDKGVEYLVPEMLTKEEPKLEDEFAPEECLGFIYSYDAVLPEGLLPRFIVSTYVHRVPGLVWRAGVVLERDTCRALVRGDILGRRIVIRVNGAGNRRELLGIIREHFERIHTTYEKLPVTEIVPVPGQPAAHVKHDLLLKYERDEREMIAVEVDRGLLDVKVKELLDGIDLPGKRRWTMTEGVEGLSGVLVRINSDLSRDRGIRVFISYSRKDGTLLDQLRAALVPYERMGKLQIWDDMLTEPGEEWEAQIVANLNRAEIVIVLLSNDFIRSSYCMEVELPRVLQRHEKGDCTMVPIVVRACAYEVLPIGKIQAILPNGKPVVENRNRDRAWLEVTKELDRVIERRKRVH